MQTLIEMITGGAAEFTPQTIVGVIVFVMILDCIGSIAFSILSVGRK